MCKESILTCKASETRVTDANFNFKFMQVNDLNFVNQFAQVLQVEMDQEANISGLIPITTSDSTIGIVPKDIPNSNFLLDR